MGIYEDRPWLSLFNEGLPSDIEQTYDNGLAMFRAAVERAGDRPAMHYFDASSRGRRSTA